MRSYWYVVLLAPVVIVFAFRKWRAPDAGGYDLGHDQAALPR